MPGTILIIDDEEQLRKLLGRIISLEGFTVQQAATLKSASELLQHGNIDIVLCDVKLPDGNGVEFTREIRSNFPLVEVILLTAFGNIPDGVQAIKNGAFDYITKGNDNDRIVPLLHQAMNQRAVKKKAAVSVRETRGHHFEEIIGNSQAIIDAVGLAKRIAPTDSNVLLLGETGTGKEVFAQAIHGASRRAAHAMVAVNCSAFPRDLLEAELFGYKAGAFTGALKEKKGLVELADNGTLFLDEIGEMSIDVQAKLLRILEDGRFIKLGDTRATQVNLRIIAATNRDLALAISEGKFREDLYYRLNVFTIQLPPLRERPGDIPALATTFLGRLTAREQRGTMHIDKPALQLLQAHSWNGNVRELKNVLERAFILADDDTITPAQLPYELQRQDANADQLSLASVEKKHIEKVLKYMRGNKTRAAEHLGIGLTTLYRKIEEYHIRS